MATPLINLYNTHNLIIKCCFKFFLIVSVTYHQVYEEICFRFMNCSFILNGCENINTISTVYFNGSYAANCCCFQKTVNHRKIIRVKVTFYHSSLPAVPLVTVIKRIGCVFFVCTSYVFLYNAMHTSSCMQCSYCQ